MLIIETAVRFTEEKVSFWRLLIKQMSPLEMCWLKNVDSQPYLIWKADSARIYIHDPKYHATYLAVKSIKELEGDLEVTNRAEAGENIKEGK